MKKLFLYARKSTDVEDKQALSIDAQINELREFAEREKIVIVGELIEKQSAKIPGRPIFNNMLARIETGEADGILAWHPDRLARNSVDGGRIIYMLDTNKINTLKFPRSWFENTPQGKLMLHNDFGFSKYYVDSLSENTKRGLREKVRRGEYPGPAPIGYINDYRTKRVFIDRERAPIVKEAFERYAAGGETQETLRVFFGEHNIRSRTGKLLGNTTVSNLLSNPLFMVTSVMAAKFLKASTSQSSPRNYLTRFKPWSTSVGDIRQNRRNLMYQRHLWAFYVAQSVATPSRPSFKKATFITVAPNGARRSNAFSHTPAKKT
ncbi:MAG: recombinase family protein [Limisphaerales bacterium]